MSSESWSKVQFEWVLPKFSTWSDSSYSSPHIQDFNGKTWRFNLYPNAKNVSIALVMEDRGERQSVPFNLEVAIRTGEKTLVVITDPLNTCARVHLSRDMLLMSIPTKLKREELQAKLRNDTLTCSLTIYPSEIPPPPPDNYSSPETDLIAIYETLLDNPRASDVVFLVTSCEPLRKIYAHSAILSARSSYFHAMFDSGFAETSVLQSERGRVEIKISDCTYDAFFALLKHLYTNRSSTPHVPARDLFLVADQYGVDDLREQMEKEIADSLEPGTVTNLLFSFAHRFPGLRAKLLQFLGDHFEAVDRTGELKRCLAEYSCGESDDAIDTDLILEIWRAGRAEKHKS